ncbi:MAG: imidazole glycerol phosphate synthase subunit HisH [Planctomycetota bacterium]|nr:MAG: imidazole glycerol phosphate synthase subunit HisH [Planctomycetota bacterium]
MGNLASVANAVDACGYDPLRCSSAAALAQAERIILPGVGSFRTAAERLHDGGWTAALHHHVAAGRPLLGICLGMQLLASWGEEGGGAAGLDLIPGRVEPLRVEPLRIPHVGWNSVELKRTHPCFAGIKPGRDFYFVHSYHFRVDQAEHRLAVTDYGSPVVCAVAQGSVLGLQFHPEKSQRNGLALLEAFLHWDGVA